MKTITGAACLCTLLITMAFEADGAATNRYMVEPGTAGITPAAPFISWATAGTNLKEVVDAANDNDAGDHVIISNGTYWLTGQIYVGNVVLTNAAGDRTKVVINGNFPVYTNRCFMVMHSNARLVGLTISNGAVTDLNGGGIYLTSGCVSNCVITGNRAWCDIGNGRGGGGLYISGGSVSDCEIVGNAIYTKTTNATAYQAAGGGGAFVTEGTLIRSRLAFNVASNRFGAGGGVYIASLGIVDQCNIISNVSYADYFGVAGGGGAYLNPNGRYPGYLLNSTITDNSTLDGGGGVGVYYGGIIRNCVIARNSSPKGGGVAMIAAGPKGRIENCTIVSNALSGMRLTDQGGTPISNVVNCIIYRNQGYALEAFGYNNCKTVMVACCVSPGYESWNNPGGTTNDPMLASIASNNFRLSSAQSSCYNRGTNLPWMEKAVDLDGHPRIDRPGGVADIGAYEVNE